MRQDTYVFLAIFGLKTVNIWKRTLVVFEYSYCVSRSPNDTTVPSQLCGSDFVGIESCGGDSGGALILMAGKPPRFVQFGIVGEGPSRCGTPGAPGLYTNVVHYMDWILETIAK